MSCELYNEKYKYISVMWLYFQVDKLVVVDIDNSEILISAGLNVPSFPEPLSFALQDAFQNLPPTYHLHMAQKYVYDYLSSLFSFIRIFFSFFKCD